jgi:ion channel POLLUX/CASTOR
MSNSKFRQVINYKFDNFMAKGGSSVFVSLVFTFLFCLFIILLLRTFTYALFPEAVSQNGRDVFSNLYITFLQMTDPGNMSQDISSSAWFKISTVISGLVGMVMFSALIAFITTALDRKLIELKKGHSKVIEKNHTLILGWNEQRVLEIIRELMIANESERDACVVILSDTDKEEMDDFLNIHLPSTGNTRLVTRSGSPSSLTNLNIVSLNQCKSVIVLASCHESASSDDKALSDAQVIKTTLAITTTYTDQERLNIVAEAFLEHNRYVIKNISTHAISTVDTRDILSKILVQTSRSVGLSVVYGEILSFDGCEMYFCHADWQSKEFGELAYHFKDGVPMGIRHSDGSLALNPDSKTILNNTDDIIILADDDSTIHFQSEPIASPTDYEASIKKKDKIQEKELLLGWTSKTKSIIKEYADYVLDGSTIDIMLMKPDAHIEEKIKKLNAEMPTLNIRSIQGNPLKTQDLMAIKPFQYDNIIILSRDGNDTDVQRSDTETIILLLLLRTIFKQHPAVSKSTKLITEVLDSENQELIASAGVNDFIISNRLVSKIFAQISENHDINRVYDDLFQEDGSEIYIKPATSYFKDLPIKISFADMIHSTQKRGEVCMGVKIKEYEHDAQKNHGITLIPDKNKKYYITAEDSLIVLAEDET